MYSPLRKNLRVAIYKVSFSPAAARSDAPAAATFFLKSTTMEKDSSGALEYEPPQIVCISVKVERGFAPSVTNKVGVAVWSEYSEEDATDTDQ